MPSKGTTQWDQATARRMYDQGATYMDIGRRINVAASLIGQFAKTHWPPRPATMAYRPGGRKRNRGGPSPLPRGARTLPDLPSLSAD